MGILNTSSWAFVTDEQVGKEEFDDDEVEDDATDMEEDMGEVEVEGGSLRGENGSHAIEVGL